MTQSAHQPLIPLADRPLAAPDYEDSQQQTIWHNPTDKKVILDLHFETPKPRHVPHGTVLGFEERTGKQRWTIEPGQTKAIPAYFDMAIQHTQCFHIDCLQMPFACRSLEEGHEKAIVGGFGPQLINKGTQKMPIRAGFIQIAPALDDALARQQAAEQAEFREWQKKRMAEEAAATARLEQERAAQDIAARASHNDSKQPAKTK